jgi:hypothetical protein
MVVTSTSLEAFERIKPRALTCKEKIGRFLFNRPKSLGATYEEISDGIPMHCTTVSARLTELQEDGLIVPVVDSEGVTVTRTTARNCPSIAWTLAKHRY